MKQDGLQEPGVKQVSRRSFLRRHRWIVWTACSALTFFVVLTVVLTVLARRFEPFVRERIVAGLSERFHSRVDLDQFHISVHHGAEGQWGLWATGRGLRIWRPDTVDQAGDTPLADVKEFSFHVPLRYEQAKTLRIAEVRLSGIEVHIPPHQRWNFSSATPPGSASQPGNLAIVRIGRVLCENAQLVLEQSKPDKPPLVFDIQKLQLTHLEPGRAVDFVADLTNPSPRGKIHTSGSFGPWNREDYAGSPMQGSYEFKNADLSTIKSIAGTLHSTGTYQGVLGNLAVNGTADVPDFRLNKYGNALPLETQFKAHVDGTDGDTWLDQVNAKLGSAQFVTSGKIVRVRVNEGKPLAGSTGTPPQQAGHIIDLKVDIAGTPVDDLLRLVSHQPAPILTGEVATKATLHISPGPTPVVQRIKIDGSFQLNNARFLDENTQKKVEDLSLRGLGHPGDLKNADPNAVRSQMQGDFHLDHTVITLPNLKYEVPGADIRLAGTYKLDGELNFDGTARMQATISQMVGGWKGFLLKPADRFFKKDGAGTLIPIHVRGTQQHPDFGVDLGMMGHTHPQRPGEQQ